MTRTTASPRYHALDSLRATAMLLGVVYHSLVFRMFLGEASPGHSGMGEGGADRFLQGWLHSFRMPLFFLISGFFGRMMLGKYGTSQYLRRRWSRIGIPMILGMFTFGPAYVLAREAISSGPGVAPGGGLGDRIFGPYSRLFHLNHLWFLWYLLVFVTIAPWVSRALGWVLLRRWPGTADRLGANLIRSGLAPIAVGLISAPALILASGSSRWSLGDPGVLSCGFPDFILHPDRIIAFYFLYFLTGWWLHRLREALPSLSRGWLPGLLFGGAAFATATWMGDACASWAALPPYPLIRAGGLTLYGLGSAATGFALIGFFQRYLDRPSTVGRYLADTSLWVYLVHQPLVPLGLSWLVPFRLPWWAQTASVSLLSVAVSLLLYEAIVRPTPLVRLFGPAAPRRIGPAGLPAERVVRGRGNLSSGRSLHGTGAAPPES